MRNLAAALELLERTPSSPERDRREFALQTSLGPALMATKGWAAPETEKAYLRAERLAETGATPEQQFALLVGLFGLLYVGGNLSGARERQKPIWDFVDRHPAPVFLLEAIHHDWSVALSAGELEASQRHVERGSSCSSRSFVRLLSRSTPLIIRPCAVMHGTRKYHGCAVVPMRRGEARSGPFHLRMNLETPCRQLSPCTRRHWFIA